jgi:hypothetical protein
MVRLPAKWAARNPQKLSPVTAIISFLPMDDPSVPVNHFIFASHFN